jgi:hypothetical protein
MATVRITSTQGFEHQLDLPPGFALTVDVDGREYVGVIMADDERPVQVVYWRDEHGEDNVTISPPGVPVDNAPADPAVQRRVTLDNFGTCIDAVDRPGDPDNAIMLGHAHKIPGHGWHVSVAHRTHTAAGLTKKQATNLLREWAQQALADDSQAIGR